MAKRLTDEQRDARRVEALMRATSKRRHTARTNLVTKIVVMQIKDRGGMAWRHNVGAFKGEHTRKDGSVNKWFVRVGEKGQSDVLGLHAGYFLSFEIKVDDDHLTEDQLRWLLDVIYRSGVAAVIRDDGYQVAQWLDLIDYGMVNLRVMHDMRDAVIADYKNYANEPSWLEGYINLMELTVKARA